MLRRIVVAVVVLVSLIPFAPSATAGGWAAVAFETPLESVAVGAESTIEYRVLAHANPETPMTSMRVDFLFLHEETGFFVAASGVATADPEVYAIGFTLDQAGDWEMRSIIRNYTDVPLLQKHPALVASADVDTAGT